MKKIILAIMFFGSLALLGQGQIDKNHDLKSNSNGVKENNEKKENCNNEKIEKSIKSLKEEVEELKKFKTKQEIRALRQEALEADKEKKDEFDLNKTFSGGQTAQQALNPEISVVVDMGFKAKIDNPPSNGHDRSGAYFRVAGFHIQSDLDPFSKTFLGIEVHPEGVELGEAFIDWSGIVPSLTIRVGKFLQNFGIINRWHMPSMDQFDNPLAPGVLLGGKLNSYGVSVHWMMPSLWADGNELFLEITNSSNAKLFGGENFSPIPSSLLRVVSYYDLGKSAYINLGFSAMAGPNNPYHGFDSEGKPLNEDLRFTYVGGVDLTFLYENPQTAKTNSWLWRSEGYFVDKKLKGSKEIKAYGFYSYLEKKVSERVSLGVRFDLTQPFDENNDEKYLYQVVPYLTFMESPWVKMRLQYNFKDAVNMKDIKREHRVVLQFIWAAGPHKHERY